MWCKSSALSGVLQSPAVVAAAALLAAAVGLKPDNEKAPAPPGGGRDLGFSGKANEWPAVGGPGGPHPKRGPWPRDPPRQQWEPPPGWVPPKKPVSSWYDRGDRLVPPAPPAPAPAPPAPAPPPKSPPNFLQQLFGGMSAASARKTPSGSAPKVWPLAGGPGGPHPKRGPWPRDPPRELWTPPPGWVPPSRKGGTVLSWYDTGKRL